MKDLRPQHLAVQGLDWDVSGSIFSTKYKVAKGGKNMAIRNMLFRASIVGAAATTAGMVN